MAVTKTDDGCDCNHGQYPEQQKSIGIGRTTIEHRSTPDVSNRGDVRILATHTNRQGNIRKKTGWIMPAESKTKQ